MFLCLMSLHTDLGEQMGNLNFHDILYRFIPWQPGPLSTILPYLSMFARFKMMLLNVLTMCFYANVVMWLHPTIQQLLPRHILFCS
ncbi:hypothetical protein GDO78_017435 [Eleutherodactylus coqui]|uniref:Uncharacterized protein n=1 Tax=Eleutherodactylus coqui TaxID=57060 RepID=A0A8J6EPD2_ELECQ|nr:hypothetical protein GDO78_017435 [Eleutherodactylus coqui]